ncbi:MAG: 2'-deoxycytidine 5'-triphosphate deaminase [Alphaproteobacteria bacterium]|jgi:dCTP deaminase|nr:2'-deoxycytidine 5'-triphosphate deaminase [Alphaproteobacteria bacterium]MDP6237457.1 2'-deoxycytidine 5'-triphosphate deaminase [Alphaproteobacteria bacterium]MDP7172498.1 2'-deoxycytidine 5'-triphosphate deaminase [Alphaproteobacteria bacterium]MDP7234243.1 2'-deoxycytidine 5'-triphosphate deaminase [Alphaproteobacteria bacterium]MDP7487055.1 2'-deoxycytidine 5'-triphosphate deaminase [Alphaproteobacteria bacterium]|tara:strand:- start:1415 stop:2551 length:1137 start_codon:yes stop_codon:yes gene_type:complete
MSKQAAAQGKSKGYMRATGILPYQALAAAVRAGEVSAVREMEAVQIQPSSLDLRLGAVAYRIRASFLPGPDTAVLEKLARYGMHEIDLTEGAVLEKGCAYMVPLQEHLRLPSRIDALANPKSSIGRLDVFTRVIADGGVAFDRVPKGYGGSLFAEIAPRTFSIKVREGSRLCQLRMRRGRPSVRGSALEQLNRDAKLVDTPPKHAIIQDDLIGVTLDLDGEAGGVVGYRARKHTDVIDLDRVGAYEAAEFWEPIRPHKGGGIVLDPDDFHILATRERVRVPPDHAAEMVAYDTMVGEFRVHYAGFFDPGFGWGEGPGSKAVLEVRSHDVPFVLEHGQTIGWLRYERLAGTPDRIYGADLGSSYQGQGLKLGKHFRPWA